MKEKIDLALISSMPYRQQSLLNNLLDNGIAILRTHLEEKGFVVEVFDCRRKYLWKKGNPEWVSSILRFLCKFQINAFYHSRVRLGFLLHLCLFPLQKLHLFLRKIYMQKKARQFVKKVQEEKIPLVGIKVWGGDSLLWSIYIAKHIKKKCPGTAVIAGGPLATGYGEQVMEQDVFDIVVEGRGEECLEKIILLRKKYTSKSEFLKAFFAQNNNSYLVKNKFQNLGGCKTSEISKHIHFVKPDYRKIDMEGKLLVHFIEDGLGCPWNKCNFCEFHNIFAGYYPKHVEDIIDEIKLSIRAGIGLFRFVGSDTPLAHAVKIANAILKNNLKIEYSMFHRVSKNASLKLKEYELLINSGLKGIFVGCETGHDLINDKVMNKGVRRVEIIELAKTIRQAERNIGKKCDILLSMIYPCPLADGVSMDEVYEANISLIKEVNPQSVLVNPAYLAPNTEWWQNKEKFGFTIPENYVEQLMFLELGLHRPLLVFGKKYDYRVGGLSFKEFMLENMRLTKELNNLGIIAFTLEEKRVIDPTPDNWKKYMADIISGTSVYTEDVINKINKHSLDIARSNRDIDICLN